MMLAHCRRSHAAYLFLGPWPRPCVSNSLSATKRLARRMAMTSNIIAAEREGD